MGRARQTAQPTSDRLNIPYSIEAWMSEETVWGEFSVVNEQGMRTWAFSCQNTELLKQDYSWSDWYTNPVFSSCKSIVGGYQRVADSSDDFLTRLGYTREGRVYKAFNPNEKRVAAFCHAGFGLTWLSHLLSVPPNLFWSGFDISCSSVTILEFKNNPDGYTAPQCVCFSDVSHIYKDNLSLNSRVKFFSKDD
jgi:probable phosphoglycerate mutase